MRLAVLADVHADVRALRDALAQAERLGCKQALCAGDVVGYGRFPEECVATIAGRRIPCVRGNHDRWAANPAPGSSTALLSSEALVYLGGLPSVWKKVVEGVRLAMCHGSPKSDMDVIHPGTLIASEVRGLLEGTEADVLICGHSHAAAVVLDLGGGMIVNPGALLREPARSHDPAAVRFDRLRRTFVADARAQRGTFGVLDLPDKTFTLHLAGDGSELPVPVVKTGIVDRWR
ncbi:MAG: metallophosphoesterase family protein [Deltaproteobacteria bacterium]|jgi:predicted phosphodiesterase|nr:metallophosphoesterase family protein [Deltaproteobacteria bacterium]